MLRVLSARTGTGVSESPFVGNLKSYMAILFLKNLIAIVYVMCSRKVFCIVLELGD